VAWNGSRRMVGSVLTLASLTTTLLVGLPSKAGAVVGCEEVTSRTYQPTGARWIDFESKVIGTSVTPVTATVTHQRTITRSVAMGGDLGGSVDLFFIEIKSQFNLSRQKTVTIESGESFSTDVPAHNRPVELRDGVKVEHYIVRESHLGFRCTRFERHGWVDIPYRWFEVVNH
jgi:hypothetical protein